MDMIVISFGHWLPQPSLYFFGDSVLGCNKCTGQNYTEVGIYDVFGKILKTTIDEMIEGRGGKGIDVIVTTYSLDHFEGEWDKLGACPKTRPFEEGEKRLEGMVAEMRRIAIEEVEAAKSPYPPPPQPAPAAADNIASRPSIRSSPDRLSSPFLSNIQSQDILGIWRREPQILPVPISKTSAA
ncbi:hypothetical protein Vadar_011474 [Vaccinium darrowii]|uniref:Uncharacterized protein n=1 Tax=Vaccinium darrowii TaxID=229202 RepID=A0ACB7YVM3_9ERIC|nr:hypothetical protein Vadar_011474 [Vaccinium darrowii]